MAKNLTKTQQFFICNLLAQYKSNREIVDLMKKVHNKSINSSIVSYYSDNSKDIIEKLRGKFLADISEIPIAQKKIRLMRAEELYAKSQELSADRSIFAGVKVLEHVQSEIEGKGANVNVSFNQFNQYNNLTDEELLERKKELETKILKIREA